VEITNVDPHQAAEVELTLKRAGETDSPKAVLEVLGLSALAGRYPRDLSSGERQRAAIAATMAGRPE
jgi:iron(III) transport system ATP-binding protein